MAVGVLLAVCAVVVLLVVPAYTVQTLELGPEGPSGATVSASFLEANGRGALVPLGLAVALAVGAWAARPAWARWALVGLFCVGCVLALPSVGLFFLPAALALVVGAALASRRTPAWTAP